MTIPLSDAEGLAVLVIDMQHDNVEPTGAIPAEGALDIVDSIVELLTAARQVSVPVIYTQHLHRPGAPYPPDFGIAHYFEPPSCIEGTQGAELVAALTPQPEDLVVTKRRYDAFFNTDLDLLLRNNEITGLLVCGVLTDGCVLATVNHARSLDYRLWLLRGCLAGTTRNKHDMALEIMSTYTADVQDRDTVMTQIQGLRQHPIER